MIQEIVSEDFGHSHMPQGLTKRGLEHFIPIYLVALEGWTKREKPSQTQSSIDRLETAFKRARLFGLMEYEKFGNWYRSYTRLKEEALNLLRTVQPSQEVYDK